MAYENFKIKTQDNEEVVCYHWAVEKPKAVVQLVHGMSEHLARYNDFAEFLVSKGFAVIGHDHRGHGKTADKIERVGHLADKDGMTKIVADTVEVYKKAKETYKSAKLFILGHSMGSFVARKLAYDFPELADGYMYSATGGHPGLKGTIGVKLAAIVKAFGKRNRSKFFDKIAFGDFNDKYEKKRTLKDWLSRDEEVVDDYINDPYCMQTFSAQFFYDLANIVLEVNNETNINKGDKTKPILFFSGSMDPVGEYTKGINKVVETFMKLEFKDVTIKIYEEGRHEMLNETNKEEVYEDVINWINRQL